MVLTTNLIEQERRRPKGVARTTSSTSATTRCCASRSAIAPSRACTRCAATPLPMFGDDRRLESEFDLPHAEARPREAFEETPSPFVYGRSRRAP